LSWADEPDDGLERAATLACCGLAVQGLVFLIARREFSQQLG
jgi:hypothetical protein